MRGREGIKSMRVAGVKERKQNEKGGVLDISEESLHTITFTKLQRTQVTENTFTAYKRTCRGERASW